MLRRNGVRLHHHRAGAEPVPFPIPARLAAPGKSSSQDLNSSITWNWTGTSVSGSTSAFSDARDYTLEVVSDHGDPSPATGVHSTYCWHSTVQCSAGTESGYTSTGWTGTGSVPSTGTAGTTGDITLTDLNSSITWNWETGVATTFYVTADGQCGQAPCYKTIQLALDAAAAGTLIKVVEGSYLEVPNWKKAGTVTISGGWKNSFTAQNGTSQIYNPRATGGGRVKLQPNFKVLPH